MNIELLLGLEFLTFLSLEGTTIYFKQNDRKNTAYKLDKTKNILISFFKNNTIETIPRNVSDYMSEDLKQRLIIQEENITENLKEEFSYIIKNFKETLNQHGQKYNLFYLYNLKNLKISQEYLTKLEKFKKVIFNNQIVLGEYDPILDIINLYDDNINTFNHEMLHLSSNNPFTTESGFRFIGYNNNNQIYKDYKSLSKIDKEEGLNNENFITIGRGLNEGYTDLLNIRYFNNPKPTYKKLSKLAYMIEQFYEDPKDMEKDYFLGSFNNLLAELIKTMSKEEAIEIILGLDYINEHPDNIIVYYKLINKMFNIYSNNSGNKDTEKFLEIKNSNITKSLKKQREIWHFIPKMV